MDKNYGKNAYWTIILCVQTGTFEFFCNYLKILFETFKNFTWKKYPIWQLTMPSGSVIKQNFPNNNVIVNYHILIIHNWSGYG